MTQSRHEYVTLLELLINNFSASFTSESFIYSGFSPVPPPPFPPPGQPLVWTEIPSPRRLALEGSPIRLHLSVSYWQLSPPKGSAE